jgi:hypothetical protein
MSATKVSRLRGVRRADGPVEHYEGAAEKLEWRCIVLDGTDVEDKDAFLESCDEAFELPEWFGMNWDALDECLADLDLDGAEGVAVLWTSWAPFAEESPKEFAVAIDVLGSAVRGWARDGVRGGVLLVGEGPEIDVDEL